MKGKKVLIGNMWYTIIDTIIAPYIVFKIFGMPFYLAVTQYLVSDELDNITTILPQDVSVYEG